MTLMRSTEIRALGLLGLLTTILALGCGTLGKWRDDGLVHVIFETQKGQIEMALDRTRAPVTVENFLKYVDGGFYEGGEFFRTVRLNPDNQPQNDVKIEVIQANINPARRRERPPAIQMERTSVTGIKHLDGTLSMPRNAPGTERDGFSITIGAQPSMDYGGMRNPDGQGFTAFGRVVRGMDVVHAIHESSAEGQNLRPTIGIIRAYRKP
jgi:peptidyl-prolyl cis-trans isomerase A (cyclophilin A)